MNKKMIYIVVAIASILVISLQFHKKSPEFPETVQEEAAAPQKHDSLSTPHYGDDPSVQIRRFRKTGPNTKKLREPPVDAMAERVGADTIANEYVIEFETTEELDNFMRLAKDSGFSIVDVMDDWNSLRLRVDNTDDFLDLVDRLKKPPKYSRNYFTRIPPGLDLPDPDQRPASAMPLKPFNNNALAALELKYNKEFRGQGIIVAILDTGIAPHPTLNEASITRIDLLEAPEADGDKMNGHGTAVASIIAGQLPDTPGVAPDVNLISIRVLGAGGVGDTFTLAKGINEAVINGADIINMSLGTYGHSSFLKDVIDYALENDVVIISSTGNDGIDAVTFPARYNGVVAVGGSDARNQTAYFSNYGSQVDLTAPAVGIDAAGLEGDKIRFSGTSAAVPFVTGTVAALMSEQPHLSSSVIVDTVLNYANDTGAPGWDSKFGSGVLNIGRIQKRDEPGLRDIAIADHYIDPGSDPDGEIGILISVQNRGTESLSRVELTTEIDGYKETITMYNLGVGETASEFYTVDREKLNEAGRISVISQTSLTNGSDYKTENNYKSSVIVLKKEDESAAEN